MNPNSALIWFPTIEAAGLPVPRTVMIPYNHQACASIFDGVQSYEFDRLMLAVSDASKCIGYPVFIRTDLSSAKHSGPRVFRAESEYDISRCLAFTIEDNEMKFWTEQHGPAAIMVREWLSLHSTFTAFNGLPIAREFRLFADSRTVLCAHPYWHPEAIEEHCDDPDWREKLAVLNEMPGNYGELCAMAMQAAAACGGDRWSVDFAMDRDGKWWLIDMARMENSWHWPGCFGAGEPR